MATIDYTKTMARLPEEELLRIANPAEGDGYVAEAIAAARDELASRGVSAQGSEAEEQTVDNEIGIRLNEPLSRGGWIGYFLLGWTTLGLVAAIIIGLRGYKRKFESAFVAALLGFVSFWSLAVGFLFIASHR